MTEVDGKSTLYNRTEKQGHLNATIGNEIIPSSISAL